MAKVRIPVEQLPPPNSNGDHAIQFRVISEDRNRISAWSNLFVIKSIGQYRPLESDVTVIIGENTVDLSWDTPIYYNYDGTSGAVVVDGSGNVSVSSASVISHNHSQDFKRHDTDIFVKWDSQNFRYHDRAITDDTSIIIPQGSASVRVIGTVATHNIPQRLPKESDEQFNTRLNAYIDDLLILFKIFDTGVQSLTWYN